MEDNTNRSKTGQHMHEGFNKPAGQKKAGSSTSDKQCSDCAKAADYEKWVLEEQTEGLDEEE